MDQNFGNLPTPNAQSLSQPFGELREEGGLTPSLGHDEASLRGLFADHRAHSLTPSRYPQKLQAAACSLGSLLPEKGFEFFNGIDGKYVLTQVIQSLIAL